MKPVSQTMGATKILIRPMSADVADVVSTYRIQAGHQEVVFQIRIRRHHCSKLCAGEGSV